jgi:hypothetical protein
MKGTTSITTTSCAFLLLFKIVNFSLLEILLLFNLRTYKEYSLTNHSIKVYNKKISK